MDTIKKRRKNIPIFKTLTQGGQVHLHQLHMLKQIVVAGLVAALCVGGAYFGWKCYYIPSSSRQMAYEVYWAKFMVATNPSANHKQLIQVYTPPQGQPYQRYSLNVLKDPLLQKTTQRVERYLELIGYKSLWIGLWSFLAVMAFWFVFGLAYGRTHHERGTTLVPWRHLKRLMRRNREASSFKLSLKPWGKCPLMKNKETSHILMTGTTGAGKTNAFHCLLPQIRKKGQRAIIVDITGDYMSRYYDETIDTVLNPLDTRSNTWDPWADCHLESHYDVLAESLIQPKDGAKDPFWDTASRVILKTALRKYASQGEYDIEKLTQFLLSSSDKEFEAFFRGTDAATFSTKSNEKTTSSIRSVLSSQIECLKSLKTTNKPFSIRNWVTDETKTGCLFITARPDQRQTLTPLISAWVDIAINALMVLPSNQDRRLWFVIDELAALQKLPRLQMGLAEGRKYGACFLIGFQSKPQLEDIYGRNGAESMLDLFNTKLFFRCTEPSTQAWISKVLGDSQSATPNENISFGAHSMRDGVSLSRHTRQTPLVMPTELGLLKDLTCYLKLPGNYPCTKLQTKYQPPSDKPKPAFLLKLENERGSSESETDTTMAHDQNPQQN